jgi:hypothetical protein
VAWVRPSPSGQIQQLEDLFSPRCRFCPPGSGKCTISRSDHLTTWWICPRSAGKLNNSPKFGCRDVGFARAQPIQPGQPHPTGPNQPPPATRLEPTPPPNRPSHRRRGAQPHTPAHRSPRPRPKRPPPRYPPRTDSPPRSGSAIDVAAPGHNRTPPLTAIRGRPQTRPRTTPASPTPPERLSPRPSPRPNPRPNPPVRRPHRGPANAPPRGQPCSRCPRPSRPGGSSRP